MCVGEGGGESCGEISGESAAGAAGVSDLASVRELGCEVCVCVCEVCVCVCVRLQGLQQDLDQTGRDSQ